MCFFHWGLRKLACLGGFLGPLALFGAVLGLEEGVTIATNARKLGGVNPGSEPSHNARSARGARALRARSARGLFPSRAENPRRKGTARRRSKMQQSNLI